jgi:hypothetical protein
VIGLPAHAFILPLNSIGNQSNQVTVNVPSLAELESIRRDLDEHGSARTAEEAKEIRSKLVMEGEDTVMALARTRIRIEYLPRKLRGKRTSGQIAPDRGIKFLTLQQMFTLLLDQPSHRRQVPNFKRKLSLPNCDIPQLVPRSIDAFSSYWNRCPHLAKSTARVDRLCYPLTSTRVQACLLRFASLGSRRK